MLLFDNGWLPFVQQTTTVEPSAGTQVKNCLVFKQHFNSFAKLYIRQKFTKGLLVIGFCEETLKVKTVLLDDLKYFIHIPWLLSYHVFSRVEEKYARATW